MAKGNKEKRDNTKDDTPQTESKVDLEVKNKKEKPEAAVITESTLFPDSSAGSTTQVPSETDLSLQTRRVSAATVPVSVVTTTSPHSIDGGHGQGAPPVGGKPGWRRVSTRQWIRDFREHIRKFQTYPYRPICGIFFWSFGYYPDMVPQDSYQRYTAHHPIAIKRHSTDDGGVPPGAVLVPQAIDTSVAPSSTTIDSSVSETTDSNTGKKEYGAPEPEGDGKKKKIDKSKSIAGGSEDGSKKSKKEKKGKKDKGDDGGTPAEEGGAEKKAKKGKGKEAAAEGGDTSGTEVEGKSQGKEKKKKGKGA